MDAGWYTALALGWWLVGTAGVLASVFVHRRIERLSAHDL
jgi:hypothetical protein